jgi:hypothetical protein
LEQQQQLSNDDVDVQTGALPSFPLHTQAAVKKVNKGKGRYGSSTVKTHTKHLQATLQFSGQPVVYQ